MSPLSTLPTAPEAAPPAGSAAPFVAPDSIVRTIWGEADTILFIFAGAAAEFALSRAVDWLFVTGVLPRDPIGRLFSTAAYARQIIFADRTAAEGALARITQIHAAVERQRGSSIPAWAHRAVLYLLIDYSERAYQLQRRALTAAERDELYRVFHRMGVALGIEHLPPTYTAWRAEREHQLRRDLTYSPLTAQLYGRYRAVLGAWRYRLLLIVQAAIVPRVVRDMLILRYPATARAAVCCYRWLTRLGLRDCIQRVVVPAQHLAQIRNLDVPPYQGDDNLPNQRGDAPR